MNKSKLATSVILSLIGLNTSVYGASAENLCGFDGAIASIQFQTCNKIGVKLNGNQPRISSEDFSLVSIQQTTLIVAKHNVVATELIAKALVEKNEGIFAPTILAYKMPESLSKPTPTDVPVQWIASK
jgi:hypothetical protein